LVSLASFFLSSLAFLASALFLFLYSIVYSASIFVERFFFFSTSHNLILEADTQVDNTALNPSSSFRAARILVFFSTAETVSPRLI
jgi:hypothetical protein